MAVNLKKVAAYSILNDDKQQEIADYLEISLTAYSKKVTGKTEFTGTELGRLAKRWNISVNDLYSTSSIL